jgi:hypothetical protein
MPYDKNQGKSTKGVGQTRKTTGTQTPGKPPKAGPNQKAGKPPQHGTYITSTPDKRPFNPRGRGARLP